MLHADPQARWRCCRHSVRCSAALCITAAGTKAAEGLSFRPGTASDARVMRQMIWGERMNPLGLAPERFTVATDSAGKLVGFGQLEQKDGYLELRSMVVDPSVRCAGSLHLDACATPHQQSLPLCKQAAGRGQGAAAAALAPCGRC